MVFIKHAAVLDQLCKHKQAIADWSTSNPALCNVQIRSSQSFRPTLGPGWLPSPLLVANRAGSIAEGFLLKKVFPSKKECHNQMRLGMRSWTKRNGLPSNPCRTPIFPTYANTYGQNTPNKSLAISPSPPFISSKQLLKVRSSTAKTNNPHPSASIALASITNLSNKLLKTLLFSNNFQIIQPPLSRPWLTLFNVNTASPILGQLGPAGNSHQAIFWPNERRTSKVADPSYPLWSHLFALCSTSWLA